MGVFDRFNEEEAEVARLRGEVKRLTREYEEATGKRPPIVSCKGDPAWHIAVVQERDALRAELAEANKARGELYDLQAKAVDALERAEAERDAAVRERDEAREELYGCRKGREFAEEAVKRERAAHELEKRAHERTWNHKAKLIDESSALRPRLEEATALLRGAPVVAKFSLWGKDVAAFLARAPASPSEHGGGDKEKS